MHFIGRKGEIVDGDQIIGLCALQMAVDGRLAKNTVVTTPMSNIGFEMTLKDHGYRNGPLTSGRPLCRRCDEKRRLNLGGEQSGHLIFLDQSTTGDGVVAALKVLEAMRRTGKPLSELKSAIKLYPQAREDVRVKRREPFESHKEIAQAIAHAESALKNRGRVFVRYSGTEPLARVMVEGEDAVEIKTLAKNIGDSIQKILG